MNQDQELLERLRKYAEEETGTPIEKVSLSCGERYNDLRLGVQLVPDSAEISIKGTSIE